MSSSLVWIQLYNEGKDDPVGDPIFIKTASLDPPVIGALIKAVKRELDLDAPLHLISVYPPKSSGDENKYKSVKKLEGVIQELKKKTPPISDDSAIDPGDGVPRSTTSKNPLIVVPRAPPPAPQQPQQHINVRDGTSLAAKSPPTITNEALYALLEEAKGSQLTELEIQYILMDYAKLIDAIVSDPDKRRRVRLARVLWLKLSIRVKTQTRHSVVNQYLFDDPVPGAFGSLGTEFQFAVKGSRLFCAKIMLDNDNNNLQREYEVSQQLHQDQICPTVMRAVDLIHLPGEPKRVAMITPFFPLPLTPLAGGLLHAEGCVNVALCGLATIKAFNTKTLCHGDIKPGNMMLTTGEDSLVVTIDFGSAAKYGETLPSTTPGFGLDLPVKASLSYDLVCLASTIYILTTGQKPPPTVHDLRQAIAGRSSPSRALQIADLCLPNHDDIDLIWSKAITSLEGDINDSHLIEHESVWPVRGG